MIELAHTLVTEVLPCLTALALWILILKAIWDWLTGLGRPKATPGKPTPPGKDLFGNPLPPQEGGSDFPPKQTLRRK